MNIWAAKAGLAIAKVPSVEHERIHGESKLRPIRDGVRVLKTILRERVARTTYLWEQSSQYQQALCDPCASVSVEVTGAR
jgi:hypothetical protein